MLEKEFQALGLNENEREVYLAVFRAGKASPARIAKETAINRTTVYSISRKLMGLGLIGEDVSAKVAYLYAEKPSALEHIFAKEAAALKHKQELAKTVAEQLATLPSGKAYSVPHIKFVEEADLTDYLYKEYARWAASGTKNDNTWWGYHDHSFSERYREWIHWNWKQSPFDTQVRFLVNAEAVEAEISDAHESREIKVLPDESQFDSSTWVIGDYVIMVQSRERPHYLVEIHDAIFARNQRQLFKTLWSIIKK
jgi:sugar-specific transcriptional regulator TrmB